ncbi:MAG: tetratricopeptide repeat protein [Woeseiaceae bacterium]|nr:tetratricopeptide repeat protein [Woeseiaceae bacterium]
MLWIAFAVMLLAAILAIVLPLARAEGAVSARSVAIAVSLGIACTAVYWQIGSPEARDLRAGESAPDIETMVATLAARLERQPEDVEGWKMLGRSYRAMGRFDDAIAAFERAVALENSRDGQTLADLGEAVFLGDNRQLNRRAAELFESSLALVPGNPKALFYSGLAAAERGDTTLAAERWEGLLATSPPPEIEQTLKAGIAQWRGESAVPDTRPPAAADVAIDVELAVGDDVPALDPATSVFVIARDPEQAGPPIAVERRQFGELPTRVTLSDADAMLPGRELSAFSRVEIVARASSSGQPTAQPGDWFGSRLVDLPTGDDVVITLNQQVQ